MKLDPSAAEQDYGPLQGHLMRQEFEAADGLTSDHLRRLAGAAAVQRGYVYYSEVAAMADLPLMRGHGVSRSSGVRVVPVADLRRLHQLMLVAIALQVLQVLALLLRQW